MSQLYDASQIDWEDTPDNSIHGQAQYYDESEIDWADDSGSSDSTYNIPGGLKDLGHLIYDIPINTVGAFASLWEDDNPEAEYDWKDIARRAREERNKLRMSQSGGEEKVLPFLDRQDIREAGPSTGFSGVAMGAGAPGMVASAVISPVVGIPTALAGSGAAAYKMDKTMFTKQLIDAYRDTVKKEENGREITHEEVADLVEKTKDLRSKHALWEAIPEAAGNVIQMSGIGTLFTATLGKNLGSKMFKTLAGMYGGELATETITQTGQHNVEIEAGLSDADPRSHISPSDQMESFKEVAPPTFVLTSLTGGGALAAGQVAKAFKGPENLLDDDFEQAETPPPPDITAGPVDADYNDTSVEDWEHHAEWQRRAAEKIQQQPEPEPTPAPDPVQEMYQQNQQYMENMDAAPDYDLKGSQNLLDKNVDEFRRVRSQEASVTALNERQQAMGGEPVAHEMNVLNQALQNQPEESVPNVMPAEQPAFQRNMETVPDDQKYRPFSGLGEMLEQQPEPVQLPEQSPDHVDDGIDVSIPEYESKEQADQKQFQSGLQDNFGMQDMPADGIVSTKPIFEHEVEPEKVNTDPSEAQKAAGNYKKDHIKIDGFDITIENPDGSIRKGKDQSGKEWENKIHGHYGYFKRTEGKDGDQVDVFIQPGTETSPKVFVIDQVNPENGRFDEHKVIMGPDTPEEAISMYMANYEQNWQGFGEITEMDHATFKDWLKDGKRTKKPLAVSPILKNEKVATPTEYKKGDRVSWKTKKGETRTGLLVEKRKNSWFIDIDGGTTTLMSENKIEKSQQKNSPTKTPDPSVGPDQIIATIVDNMLNSEIERGKKHGIEATQEQIDVFIQNQTRMFKDFVNAINDKDFQVLKDRLHRGNKNTLKLFTEITGLATKTQKATNESIRSLDPGKYDEWVEAEKLAAEKAAEEKKKAREEKEKKELLEGPVNYLGQRMTFEQYINTLLEDGYTDVEIKGSGNLSTLRLVKHENNGKGRRLLSDVFRRKDEREYIQEMVDQHNEKLIADDIAKEEQEMADNPEAYITDQQASELFGATAEQEVEPEGLNILAAKEAVKEGLSSGGFKTIVHARKAVSDKLGLPLIKGGTKEAKAVEESIEAAAIEMAQDILKKYSSPEKIYDALVDLQGKLPNLSTRTSTSIMNQAYSTPLPLAYVAAQRAGINQSTTVYEPSAGNGALIFTTNPKKTTANELNIERARNLNGLAKNIMMKDGTEVVLKNKVDVVIGNPPFGTVKDDAGKTKKWQIAKQYETSQIDHAMVFKALESMNDQGSAVFIIGSVKDKNGNVEARKKQYRSPDKVRFYKTLFNRYNVVDMFTMSGDLYKKQGAGWPVDILVIDGKGKSNLTLPGAEPPRFIDSLDQLKEQLNGPDQNDTLGAASGDRSPQDGDSGNTTIKPEGDNERNIVSPESEGAGSDRAGTRTGRGGKPSNDRDGDARVDGGKPADTKPGDSRAGTNRNEPTDAGLSKRDNIDRPSDRTTSKSKPESKKDSGGKRSEPLDRQPDTSIEDEFSPDNLLAEWDRQSEKITAQEKAAETKQHLSNALDKFKQINNLLGERGSLSTDKTDENVYGEIRALLQDALNDLIQAGKSAKDFVQLAIKNLSPKARPYFERFVKQDMVLPGNNKAPSKKKPKKPSNTDTQVAYEPASGSSAIGTLTPVNMATASKKALATIQERYGSVDQYVADELGYTLEEINGKPGEFGYFSGEQVDAIALAIHNIGNGAGFIIGDQTGVGKGRVVAAMQRYAMKNNLTPIFVTEKPNLYTDMYRDFVDIGMADMADKIFMTNGGKTISLTEDGSKVIKTKSNHNAVLNKITVQGVLPDQYKTIFTTYDQLNKTGSPQRQFISEMIRHRGMLIMDESHNAGGTEGNKATATKVPRSVYFRTLVQDAHSVFYSSATYAKRPGVMDLYSKTDMRLAVDDVANIGGAISQGGVPLQQAVAAMLVEAGQYVRRERSFDGVDYHTESVEIDKKSAEKIADALAEIKRFSDGFAEPAFENIGDREAGSGAGVSGASAAGDAKVNMVGFSSVMHNLINQMLLSMKTQGAVDKAIAAFKSGQKPVITLANTMGSFIERHAETYNLKPGDAIGLRFNDLIGSYLEKTREYTIREPFRPANETIRGYISDEELGEYGVKEFERIKDKIYDLDIGNIPISPVDYIIHKLAEAGIRASEITGRTDRIEYRNIGKDRYTKRPGSEKSTKGRTKIIYDFNTDKLDALILNKSGSTGLSLHALPKYGGHTPAQRHMIILQAEGNIDTHMQMLGRVHRAGQVSAPEYTQLMGDIPSEKRPAAVLATKMASLNANTTAAKESDLSAKETVDFMNKYGDRVAAGMMADFPEMHERLGMPLATDSRSQSGLKEEGAIKKITGRIPLLPLADQEQLYTMLESSYLETIEQLNATGENDLEAKTFDLDAKTISKTTVFDNTGLSADSPFTAAAVAEQVDMKKIGRSYTSKQVVELLGEYAFDQKKVDKSLDEILEKAEERHEDQKSESLNRFVSYEMETVDDIEDEQRADAVRTRLEGVREDWEYLYSITQPGHIVDVKVGDQYIRMTALKVHQTGKPKNPLALGTWKVTFAVPDSMRRVTYPFSYLNRMNPEYAGPSKATKAGETSESTLKQFDNATRTARETRTIITGNMLAAYGRYQQGRIINFKTNKGDVRQGVLMPADFNLEQAERERPVFLNNPKDLEKITKEGIHVRGAKGDIKIIPGTADSWSGNFMPAFSAETVDEYLISVPAAKASGSKYFLNKELLKAVGQDFIKVKNRMTVTVSKIRMKKIFNTLINRMNEPFYTMTEHDRSKQVLGIDEIAFEEFDKDDQVRYSKKKSSIKQDGKYGKGVTTENTKTLERSLGKKVKSGQLTEVSVPDNKVKHAKRLGKIFGKKIIFLENSDRAGLDFEGVTIPELPNTIFIDAATKEPLLQVAAHELLHTIKRTNPKLYKTLRGILSGQVQNIDQYKKDLESRNRKTVSDALLMEELLADLVGEHFTDTEFWHNIKSKMPGKTFKQLAFRIKTFLRKLLNTLGFKNKPVDKYYQNIEKAIQVVDRVLNAYVTSPQQEVLIPGDQPTFLKTAAADDLSDIFGPEKADIKGLVDEVRAKGKDTLITKTLDRLHPIKRLLGDETYKMHRMLTGIKSATFAMFLEHGPLAWAGNTMTVNSRNKGVLPFLKSIGPDWQNLLYWVAAKRAEQLEREGRENWLTKDKRDRIYQKVGTHSKTGQSWKSLNIKFQAINKNVLDIAEQAGLIDPDAREMWESNFYIPFYRIFEDETTKQEFLSGPHRSKKHISAQIRKLKGGDSKLGDPLENVLTNWMHLIDSAARNKARASAFEVGQQVGMIEKVERSELVKVLGSEKVERFAVVKEGNTKATRLFDTDFEAQAFIDSKPGPYKIEKRITYNVQFGSMKDYGLLSFQKNGEAVYFKTEDQDLYEALSEIDTQAFSNIFMRMMGSAKRALSYGATFGPAFRIRNMLRDTVHTAVVSKSFKPFYDTARGFVKSMREDQDYIEYMASGFGFGSSYIHSDDPQVGAKYIKKIVASEGKGALRRIIDPLKPWDNSLFRVWEKIGSASENAARLGLYTNLKKEGMDNFNAGFEGRDLMDFSMIGSAQATQMMVRIIPFLNARMQGLYKLGRSSRENPKAFLLKASILTTAALTLWSIFKDDDRYKDLEDWDKWTYFHFWIGEEHWRIPKPFEIGALFASLPESIANVMNGSEEGRFVLEWFVHTTRDTFNVDRPQLFKPAAEVNFNYDTFRKRKIVPTGLENLETSEQYQPWTSDTMKLVGGMTGMSPLKLEHLVKGYFSTLGAMVLSGTDVVVRGMTDAPSLPEGRYTPFDLGLKVDGSRGSKYVSRFYDLYSEIDELNRTYKHYIKTGQVEKAQDIYIKYEKLLRAKTAAYKYRKALSALTAEIKKTYRRKDFTAEEKSQHIDKLTSLKNKLSKAFFQSVKG